MQRVNDTNDKYFRNRCNKAIRSPNKPQKPENYQLLNQMRDDVMETKKPLIFN